MPALRGLRQPAVGRRLDFETPVAGHLTCAWIVVTDVRHDIDVAPARDRGLDMDALGETPAALDHRVGCIDAIDNNGHARPAWNHDIEAVASRSRPRRSDQNGQRQPSAHCLESRLLATL